jgi:hypothetical protein
MTASIFGGRDHDNSRSEPAQTQEQPPARLSVIAMAAIVAAGIAATFIAQGLGLSFRLSIVVSALVVGVLISILHAIRDSRHSSARLPDDRNKTVPTITTEQSKTSRAARR